MSDMDADDELSDNLSYEAENDELFDDSNQEISEDEDDEDQGEYQEISEDEDQGGYMSCELLTVPQRTITLPEYTDPFTEHVYVTRTVTFPVEYYWIDVPTVMYFYFGADHYITLESCGFDINHTVRRTPVDAAYAPIERNHKEYIVFVPLRREYHKMPEVLEGFMTRTPPKHGSHAMQWGFQGLFENPLFIAATLDEDRTMAASDVPTDYLPFPWTLEYDDRSKRYYFVDAARGRTTWEPPADPPDTDTNWEITYDYPGLPFDKVWTNKEKRRGHEAGTFRIGITPQPIDKLVKTALPQGSTMRRFLDQVVYTDHLSKTRQKPHPRLMRGNPLAPGVLIEAVEGRLKVFRFMCCYNSFESVNYVLVSREHLFEDSFKALMCEHHPHQLRRQLKIIFTGEAGVDVGGVSRHWYSELSNIFLNPKNGLFEESIPGYYIISQFSVNRPKQLKFYRFFGRFIAMALLNDYNISPGLSRLMLKQLMGHVLVIEDLRENMTDTVYSAIEDIRLAGVFSDPAILADLRFEQTTKFNTIFELVEGGSQRELTLDGIVEYIPLYIDYSVNRGKGTMSAIRQGFAEVIPTEWLSLFDETELERVLGGELGDIDVEEWKEYTIHPPNMNETQQNTWDLFWEALGTMNQNQLRGVLKFATGSDRVPFGGFVNLKNEDGRNFRINLPDVYPQRLPQASTCFLDLTLFAYQSREDVLQMLTSAVIESGDGFLQP